MHQSDQALMPKAALAARKAVSVGIILPIHYIYTEVREVFCIEVKIFFIAIAFNTLMR